MTYDICIVLLIPSPNAISHYLNAFFVFSLYLKIICYDIVVFIITYEKFLVFLLYYYSVLKGSKQGHVARGIL